MANTIISIGRQFGSGGHEIGEKLSKRLGIPLYDKNLIEMASEKMGLSKRDLKAVDETALMDLLSAYRLQNPFAVFNKSEMPLNDHMYLVQSSIIKTLAKKESCIIIGRCADYVLKDHPKCINIFICADMDDRIRRIMMRHFLPEKEAIEKIKRVDKRRKIYYENYTGQKWGNISSHQLLLNVSRLGMEDTLGVIRMLYEQRQNESRA